MTKTKKATKKVATKTKSKMTIQSELYRIQQSIVVPKGKNNEFGKFNYRSAEDILSGYKKVKGETIIKSIPEILVIDNQRFMKVTVYLYLKEDKDQVESAVGLSHAPLDLPKMSTPQVTGAANSYAKKYALENLFAIDDEKLDPDSQEKKLEEYGSEIAMIDTIEGLNEYWDQHKNEKLGKKFVDLLAARKARLKKEGVTIDAND
jgi:hypothetical protein